MACFVAVAVFIAYKNTFALQKYNFFSTYTNFSLLLCHFLSLRQRSLSILVLPPHRILAFPFPLGRVGVGFLPFAHMYAPYAVYKVRLVPNYMLPTGYLCLFPLSSPISRFVYTNLFAGRKKSRFHREKRHKKSSNIVLILPLKIGVILVGKTEDFGWQQKVCQR